MAFLFFKDSAQKTEDTGHKTQIAKKKLTKQDISSSIDPTCDSKMVHFFYIHFIYSSCFHTVLLLILSFRYHTFL